MNGNRPTLISAVPWLVALIGLAVPLVGGGGAGWVYVVGWLVVLVGIFLLKPIRFADRRDRIFSAAITAAVLVVPGLIVGGLYLVPAALAWLVIEINVPCGLGAGLCVGTPGADGCSYVGRSHGPELRNPGSRQLENPRIRLNRSPPALDHGIEQEELAGGGHVSAAQD